MQSAHFVTPCVAKQDTRYATRHYSRFWNALRKNANPVEPLDVLNPTKKKKNLACLDKTL